jgi:hypothetical protein
MPTLAGIEIPGDGDADAAALQLKAQEKYALLRSSPRQADDWAKGMFGGRCDQINPPRTLTASVQRVSGQRHYEVVVTVTSSDPLAKGASSSSCTIASRTRPRWCLAMAAASRA